MVDPLQNVKNVVNISIIRVQNTAGDDRNHHALVEMRHGAKPENAKWRRENHVHFVAKERIVPFDVNSVSCYKYRKNPYKYISSSIIIV